MTNQIAISTFQFEGRAMLRVVTDHNGDLWFISADLSKVLGVYSSSFARVDDSDKRVFRLSTSGGAQQLSAISEPAFYSIIINSHHEWIKPARNFLIGLIAHPKSFTINDLLSLINPPVAAVERVKANHRVKKHKRRSAKASSVGYHTADDIQSLLIHQRNKCYYCRQPMTGGYTVDHIIPLSRGGSNSIDNIALACKECNSSKGAKLPHEWNKGGRLL